jgi:hypothetical protein
MGGYEPDPQPWTTGDVPDDFQFRLFDDDYEHFAQHVEQAVARVLKKASQQICDRRPIVETVILRL